MKKIIIILLIMSQVNTLMAQINKEDISFELRYPIPFGDNYLNKGLGEGYFGLIDLGADYNIVKVNNLGIGILLNSSILRLSESDVNLMILSPKISFDYKINVNNFIIIPAVAFGYSNWRFRSPETTTTDEYGNVVEIEEFKENYSGFVFKGATKLVLNSNKQLNWYLLLAYEFTRLEKPDNGALDSGFNRNMHILYPGIGLLWKFKKR